MTRERHRRGEDPFRVVGGLSQGIDGVLRQLFTRELGEAADSVALVAVGGYGRRELCPRSDIDLLFLRRDSGANRKIESLVRLLWDGGFQLGQSVRTVAECFKYMADDPITAATLLENRFLCGNRVLYEKLQGVVNKFRKRRGEAFARAKFGQLRESLFGPGRTIWVLEPHLKDGVAGLRDLQRVLWIERVRKRAATFEEFSRAGGFAPARVAALREAYGFSLRVRCELHFTSGIKLDILERDSVAEIARNLGYEGTPLRSVEKLMADYYRHASSTYRFLRHYLETGARGRRYTGKLSHKVLDLRLNGQLIVDEGVLFLRERDPPAVTGERILEIFLVAQRDDLRLSESLCHWIRERVEPADSTFQRGPRVYEKFLRILRGRRNVGRIVKAMREAGVLEEILPEFRAIDGLVNYDGHHQFTVDEHTLHTLEILDRLEWGREGTPPEFRALLERIEDRLPLRVALLLHDLGKGLPTGDHSVSGTHTAAVIGERLGLDEPTRETVCFLVYHHLRMFVVSERRDFTEDRVVDQFARLVGTPERLDMLYLLTYVDVSSVGPGTWTAWKGVQLAELYERARECLGAGPGRAATLEERLETAGLEPEDQRRVLSHCADLPESAYSLDVLPERMLFHVGLIEGLRKSGRAQVGCQDLGEFQEFSICCRDRPRVFADLCGLLFSEGFNLLGARIFSRGDGIALDEFWVEVADDVRLDVERRAKRLRSKLRKIDAKAIVVQDLIREWVRSYRFRRSRPGAPDIYGPRVAVDNDASERHTLIEVIARDRPGLLYDLASAIHRLGLDVRSAKVSTITDRAHDVFYVVEADGSKVTQAARMMEIEQELAIEARASTSELSEGGLPGGGMLPGDAFGIRTVGGSSTDRQPHTGRSDS